MTEPQVENASSAQENIFSGVDPNALAEDLKPIYKSMQADYTRKTQELSKMRKDYAEKEAQFQSQLKSFGAAELELKQWREWYANLEKQAGELENKMDTNTSQPVASTGVNYTSEPENKQLSAINKRYEEELARLRGEVLAVNNQLKESREQVNKMFSFHSQLNDITGRRKDVNKEQLLDYAVKHGITNLEHAYKELYHDAILQEEVDKRVQEELKKQRTAGIHTTGTQMVYKPSDKTPRSFAEATEQIIRERRERGL